MIIKAIVALIALFIIPELLGMLILRFWEKQKNNIILAFVLGYVIEFAIGQLVSIPLILTEGSLTQLLKIYVSIVLIFCFISIFVNITRITKIGKELLENIKKMPKLLTAIFIVLVMMQLLVYVKYGYINEDDAYYVATATTSIQTDTLFKYSALTGNDKPDEQVLMRYRLGPFPLYYAILSKVLDIHPAIVAHFILPIILIPIVYMVYWLFAQKLFKENKKSAIMFMIFICILHIFSYYSGKNNFILALLRIWQGKAVLASIIIPFITILFLYAEEDDLNIVSWICLTITVLGGSFLTTMAIGMVPVTLMILSFIFEIIKLIKKQTKILKSFTSMTKCLISCMPCVIYGIMYFQNYIK